MPRVAIVGGGIAGLSVAYELTRRGCTTFSLYEASSRLGGTIETVCQDEFVIECGPDSWVSEKPWARELAVELGLEDEIVPSLDAHRRNYILDGGSLIAMPEAMRMMVPTDLDAIATSPLFTDAARRAYRDEPARADELKSAAAGRPAEYDESVAAFVRRHFGEEVTRKVAGPLLSGIFGGDIEQLSVRAVMEPFVRMERKHGSLIVALQSQQRLSNPAQSVFTSLTRGLQSLTEAMIRSFSTENICLNERVMSLGNSHSKAGPVWQLTSAAGVREFDEVVLATPVHVTRELVAACGEELQCLLDMEASSAVVAAFAFTREQSAKLNIPRGFGFLVPQTHTSEAEPRLLACTFVDQKFPHSAPSGCTLLRAFYGGMEAPRLLDAPDVTILDLARQQLSGVLGSLPEAALTLVRRWPRSLPQYKIGHLGRVTRIEAIVGEKPGLHLIGNAFHGVGLPDLIRRGRSLAASMLGGAAEQNSKEKPQHGCPPSV